MPVRPQRVTLMDFQMGGEGVKNEQWEGGNVHKFGWMQRQPKGPVLSHETLDPFLRIRWMETSEY